MIKFWGFMMKLNEIYHYLVSYGYHPDEVEYALTEVLQYKSPEQISQLELRILCSMLEERIQVSRAKLIKNNK
jgi:hypothetical protein